MERLLSNDDAKEIYGRVCDLNLEPYEVDYHVGCSEYYYEIDGTKYHLIYRSGLWSGSIVQGD